jgi:Putative adhesin
MRIGLSLAGALLVLTAGTAASAAGDTTVDRQVAAQPRGVVEITNVSGEIEVSGWDRGEVSVHAELASDVERVDVSSEGGHTRIKVLQPHGSGHGGEAHLRVQIPKDSELDVSAVSAEVRTSGVLGVQRLSTLSGDISAELAGADAELKTVSGDVRLKGHGAAAQLRVSTVSGDVHLDHGGGDIETTTVNGELIASLDSAHGVRARTTSGNLRFEGSLAHGATLEATSISGNLTVRTAAEGGFAYEVSSFSGDIGDCFDASPERTSKYAPGTRLTGSRGEGMGHVRLKTMSGDVQLCDHR